MKENITIHYADDDAEDLEIFKKAAEKSGAEITLYTYNNGDDFLNGIKKESSKDIIAFVDINMPGKSGLTVLREIRDSEELKHLPVVMYSTSNDPKVIMVSQDIGANLYIVKPSSFSILKDLIYKVTKINWQKTVPGEGNFVMEI